jgi:outer membrane immunogenic protein
MSNPFTVTRPSANRPILAVRIVTIFALACGSTAAGAADMPMKDMPTKATAPPVYQWTGCYVGLNGGGGASASNVTTSVDPGTYLGAADATEVNNDGSGSGNGSNFLGGGQAGCNWQSGTVVAGFEGDFDYYRSNSNFLNNVNSLPTAGTTFGIGQSLKTDYLATMRPRIGIAADRDFGYVTGGVAFTEAHYSEIYSDGAGGIGTAVASKFLTGWTAGAGWEHAWSEHWNFRVEYLFASFGTTNAAGFITGPVGSNPLHGSGDLIIHVARAGVNFKF